MTNLRVSLPLSSTMFLDPDDFDFFLDAPHCYNITSDKKVDAGHYILYGRPGGCVDA